MKVLIAICFLLFLGASGCEKKTEPVPVGEMNEYRDPGYGFKIHYPKEWKQLGTTGKAVFAKSACVGCHTIAGVSAGVLAPNLTHFGGRSTLAAGMWPNTPDNVAAWVRDPQRLKPGVKMPDLGLTEEQAKAVAAYLTGLK